MKILTLSPMIDGVCLEGGELPEFDLHIPLLSLPRIFGTRLDSVPASSPYLFADPELIARWREELGYIDAFKVGINWQGNPKYRGDRRRSIALAHFAPLAAVKGARLVSLQRNHGVEQIKEARFSVTELGGQIDDASGPFMDTAAAMMNLDLFITSDTALAHLAVRWERPCGSRFPTLLIGDGCSNGRILPGIPRCASFAKRSSTIGRRYSSAWRLSYKSLSPESGATDLKRGSTRASSLIAWRGKAW